MISEQPKKFLWNYRGVGSNVSLRVCRQYDSMTHPNIFIVMKTKADLEKLTLKIRRLGFDGFDFAVNCGFAGGIAFA